MNQDVLTSGSCVFCIVISFCHIHVLEVEQDGKRNRNAADRRGLYAGVADRKYKKPDGMDLELRYSHSYGWDRHLPDQFNAEKMGDRLSGRTWTGQPFDIWNPRIQRSFFTLRSVSFSSFVSFC